MQLHLHLGIGAQSSGTAGASPASGNAFTQGTLEAASHAMWHSTKAGEPPAVPVRSGLNPQARVTKFANRVPLNGMVTPANGLPSDIVTLPLNCCA